jgi:hypothetical protein
MNASASIPTFSFIFSKTIPGTDSGAHPCSTSLNEVIIGGDIDRHALGIVGPALSRSERGIGTEDLCSHELVSEARMGTVTMDVADRAAELRGRYRLSTPDAIQLAISIGRRARVFMAMIGAYGG